MNQLRGTVTRITVKKNVSSDLVQTVVMEVYGDITWLHSLMDSPLKITVEIE